MRGERDVAADPGGREVPLLVIVGVPAEELEAVGLGLLGLLDERVIDGVDHEVVLAVLGLEGHLVDDGRPVGDELRVGGYGREEVPLLAVLGVPAREVVVLLGGLEGQRRGVTPLDALELRGGQAAVGVELNVVDLALPARGDRQVLGDGLAEVILRRGAVGIPTGEDMALPHGGVGRGEHRAPLEGGGGRLSAVAKVEGDRAVGVLHGDRDRHGRDALGQLGALGGRDVQGNGVAGRGLVGLRLGDGAVLVEQACRLPIGLGGLGDGDGEDDLVAVLASGRDGLGHEALQGVGRLAGLEGDAGKLIDGLDLLRPGLEVGRGHGEGARLGVHAHDCDRALLGAADVERGALGRHVEGVGQAVLAHLGRDDLRPVGGVELRVARGLNVLAVDELVPGDGNLGQPDRSVHRVGEGGAGGQLLVGNGRVELERHGAQALDGLEPELDVVSGHGELEHGGREVAGRDVLEGIDARQAGGVVGVPAPEGLAVIAKRPAVDGHSRALVIGLDGVGVRVDGVGSLVVLLIEDVFVGRVLQVEAARHVEEVRALDVVRKLLDDLALARVAGAHANPRSLVHVAHDVGPDALAAVGVEEEVVGIAVRERAAGVAVDEHDAPEVDVVLIVGEDAATLVRRGVAGNLAIADVVVLGVVVDGAAVGPGAYGGVAREGAAVHVAARAVQVEGAAVAVVDLVVLEDAVLDGDAGGVDVDGAALALAHVAVERDARNLAAGAGGGGDAAAMVGRRVARDGRGAVAVDVEVGAVEVDAATAVTIAGAHVDVVVDAGGRAHVDVRLLGVRVDAGAFLGDVVADGARGHGDVALAAVDVHAATVAAIAQAVRLGAVVLDGRVLHDELAA